MISRLPRTFFLVDDSSGDIFSTVVYGVFADPVDGVCIDARDLTLVGHAKSFVFVECNGDLNE